MSESKYTPGPWTAEAKDLGGEVPSWRVYNMPEGQQVASVHRWNGEGDEANAHLIAAAPDLLEACKEALVRLECHNHPDGRRLDNLRAAIAKAEGQE